MLNNRYERIASFRGANGYLPDIHEFKMTARGTAFVLSYRTVLWDLTSIGGQPDAKVVDNVVQEVDLQTGAVLFEWHALGDVSIAASRKRLPEDDSAWDYLHVNSISSDGESILISGRWTSTIYRINRSTANVQWRLRGDGKKPVTNSFRMGKGTSFAYQHDASRLSNGDILLFDNGTARGVAPVNKQSSAMILRLASEGSGRKATLVRRYRHPVPVLAKSQANADLQENGNIMVGWGSVRKMTEFTPDGSIAFDATFDLSAVGSYRAYKAPWQGFPTDRPAIDSESGPDGSAVYASWNGSTRVDSWVVFSGEDRDSLTRVGGGDWAGLETKIKIRTPGPKVQVAALDADGNELARSGLIELRVQSR
jgi:hypothetical protein